MEQLNLKSFSHHIAKTRPRAAATLRGSDRFPEIGGTVEIYPAGQGTLVVAEVFGLPVLSGRVGEQYGPFFAFHLHEGSECGSGGGNEPFGGSGSHYNPENRPHPFHAGDFPPLLSDGGYAYLSFYTGRLTPEQAIGRTVVVHQHAEDFTTQPSGNAGGKLACGVVRAVAASL